MNKEDIKKAALDYLKTSPFSCIPGDGILDSSFSGAPLFDGISIMLASPRDSYLMSLSEIPEAGIELAPPEFWLKTAKTVLSIFLPFSEQVVKSNVGVGHDPSPEWLYARVDGQKFINGLCVHLCSLLVEAGYEAVAPSLDERFVMNPCYEKTKTFTSNWSERHVAFAAGHGTFSLSGSLITREGTAGRLGSLVTSLELEPDKREYTDLYEYCSMCGACVRRCPVGAISIRSGKNHRPCSDYLDEVKARLNPYYGCGKCQAGVPCQRGIPPKQRS